MQITRKKLFMRLLLLTTVVLLLGLVVLFPPALVNEAPFWDDKAYINNALIASGRLIPSDAKGPYAEERPPLFWWFLTGFYALNAPVETARLISPTLTLVGLVAMFLLVSKVFGSILAGFLSVIFTMFLDYFVLTTSYILTDAFGSVLAFLALLSFSLGLRYGPFLWLSGGLTALSIIARDQNLLLIPVMLLSMGWIAKTSKIIKTIYVISLLGIAFIAISLRQELFLQMLSDIFTPVVLDPLYIAFLSVFTVFSVLAVYKVAEQKNLLSRKPSIEERMLDMFLAVAIMLFLFYPFFIDNIRLGEEFQVEGKGIFSRPVAHSIMVRNDIIRSGLDTSQRVVFWLSSLPALLTAPLLLLAVVGVLTAFRNRLTLVKPIFLWFVFTVIYIAVFTHIELRFLVPAVPPAATFAGYAVSRLAVKKRFLAASLTAVVLVYAFGPTNVFGLLPSFDVPTTVRGWLVILGFEQSSERWFSDYISYLETVLKPPNIQLPLINILTAWTTVIFLGLALFLGFKNPL